MPSERQFPKRLRWLRARSGLSLQDFGQRCGVTKSQISRLESGQRTPSRRFTRVCSDAFHIPWEWLERGVGPRPRFSTVAATGTGIAGTPGADSDHGLKAILRIVLEAAPVSGEAWLRFVGGLLESQRLGPEIKHKAVVAAILAYTDKRRDSGTLLARRAGGKPPGAADAQ